LVDSGLASTTVVKMATAVTTPMAPTAPFCRKGTAILVQHGEPIGRLQVRAGHVTGTFTLQRYTHYSASARRTVEAIGHILLDEQP
jgi:hypothetical protein